MYCAKKTEALLVYTLYSCGDFRDSRNLGASSYIRLPIAAVKVCRVCSSAHRCSAGFGIPFHRTSWSVYSVYAHMSVPCPIRDVWTLVTRRRCLLKGNMRRGDLRGVIFALYKDDRAQLEALPSSYFNLMCLRDKTFSLREGI